MLLSQHVQIKQIIGTINHTYAESSIENGRHRGARNRDEIERKSPAQRENISP
ncbi:hypothetical protein KKH3_13180 [Pectobacterium actinidiae]|nr:hypothetical protein KKH3_13180 [Pectobacterium actinidiae]